MKKNLIMTMTVLIIAFMSSCKTNSSESSSDAQVTAPTEADGAGQSAVQDDVSEKNVVQVAAGSKDHS
ncbi:MAG TPA: hypothetical protein PLK15_06265, partial [Chitinophagales bacterium]|nr:hypothetical protein [Chitinophagales bacterium]